MAREMSGTPWSEQAEGLRSEHGAERSPRQAKPAEDFRPIEQLGRTQTEQADAAAQWSLRQYTELFPPNPLYGSAGKRGSDQVLPITPCPIAIITHPHQAVNGCFTHKSNVKLRATPPALAPGRLICSLANSLR